MYIRIIQYNIRIIQSTQTRGGMVIHQRNYCVEEIGWHIIERYGGIEKVWLPPLKPTEMCINADNVAACRGQSKGRKAS